MTGVHTSFLFFFLNVFTTVPEHKPGFPLLAMQPSKKSEQAQVALNCHDVSITLLSADRRYLHGIRKFVLAIFFVKNIFVSFFCYVFHSTVFFLSPFLFYFLKI